ncbi:MAG: hypothetical protein AAF750_18140 [Planctomycetota bacterium]
MSQIANNPNAVRVLMRLIGIGLLVWIGWLCLLMGQSFVSTWSTFNAWELPFWGVLVLLLTVGAGAAAWIVRQPNRLQLGLLIFAAVFFGHIKLMGLISAGFERVFVAEAATPAAWVVGWVLFLLLCVMGLSVEWWFSKRAGFVNPDERWWQEDNIRAVCIGAAWLIFIGFVMSPLMPSPDEKALLNEPFDQYVPGLTFLGVIAFCVVFARRMPVALMTLTGVEIRPRPPRERRRGFRLC